MRQVSGARDRALARFEVEKARVCCAQEHNTPALVSTRPTRLTVEQIIVAVCKTIGRCNVVLLPRILGFIIIMYMHEMF